MGFSAKQLQALRRSLNRQYVRTREANGRELSYIEGWYAISEANRIFGFDGWNRETVESRCVLARENRGLIPRRLCRQGAHHRACRRRDLSSVTAMGRGRAAASPRATSTTSLSRLAETDATKRALATFGKPFGLELYRKDKDPALQTCPSHQPGRRKSTHSAPSGLTPRRYDTDPAAIPLLWAATPELDDVNYFDAIRPS